jgi:hypothetical protein
MDIFFVGFLVVCGCDLRLKPSDLVQDFSQGHRIAMVFPFSSHVKKFLLIRIGRLGIVLPQPHGGRQNILVNK